MKSQRNQSGSPTLEIHPLEALQPRPIAFDPLYEKARQILVENPNIGKRALGLLLGIPGRSARSRIARYRGETEGHSLHADYIRVRQLMEQQPQWTCSGIAQHLRMNPESVRLQMARWFGATSSRSINTKPPETTQATKVATTMPAPQPWPELTERFISQLREAAPKQPNIMHAPGRKGMLEICISDLHLGKHCWEGETGQGYNPQIAETMFWSALDNLLNRGVNLCPEKILFVVGNDFFNVDNMYGTTTAGIPQDESARWQESFLHGYRIMVQAVERLRQVAPVHVLVVPGNHDTQRLWYLGEVLAAWFRHTDDVHIDHDCQPRKYVTYGKNLIGFCHGHAESHDRLPLLMASERPAEWAGSRFREWHLGHFHAKTTKVFYAHKELSAVLIRIMSGLCPPDAWHSARGFRSNLAAEAYFWERDRGCIATFTHYADVSAEGQSS